MALLAEELVEEWLNRQGFFTIRGAKVGVGEMDLLAVKPTDGTVECRHIEVQASTNAISYIAGLTKRLRDATGRATNSAKQRTREEQEECVAAWVEKKFLDPKKAKVRDQLARGPWSFELVVHDMAHPEELEMMEARGVRTHRFADILRELEGDGAIVKGATGDDFVKLVLLGESLRD
jgi:Holliday junction resolvase-like predicted endonuclease